jgi:hypothetical protein
MAPCREHPAARLLVLLHGVYEFEFCGSIIALADGRVCVSLPDVLFRGLTGRKLIACRYPVSRIEKRVVDAILRFTERDLSLRGVRVFAGSKQVGVDYSPELRLDTQRDEKLLRGIRRAKYGILSFTHLPLAVLSNPGRLLLFLRGGAAACKLPPRIHLGQ